MNLYTLQREETRFFPEIAPGLRFNRISGRLFLDSAFTGPVLLGMVHLLELDRLELGQQAARLV